MIGPRLAVARQKAVNYLEIKIDSMRYGSRPYEIAVVTYALMLNKRLNGQLFLSINIAICITTIKFIQFFIVQRQILLS